MVLKHLLWLGPKAALCLGGKCRADGGLVAAHLRAHNTSKSVQARSADFILGLRLLDMMVAR